jgi:hypothetical protein
MTNEKWQKIKGEVLDKFEVEDQGEEHIDDEGGIDVDFIVFLSPMGKIRLEFVTKPVVLDRKTTYSKRIGSETKIDYVYSEDEKSQQLFAYKWSEADDEWEEMDSKAFDN